MRCPNDLELQSYGDQELTPRQARRVRQHLGICSDCQAKLKHQNSVVQLLQLALPTPATPVLAEPVPAAQPSFKFSNRWVLAAAASLVLLIASGVVFNQIQSTRWTPETEILSQYVNLYHEGPTELMNYNL